MISWNGKGVTTRSIAAGHYDKLVRERARATRALGQPVLIRWFWEMDGKKKADFAGTPGQYVAAWRHVVRTFRSEGAENVSWVWCPNASAFNDGEAQKFYPGDDFVDWTCADGYNWAPGRPGDGYRPFPDIFAGFYAWASLHDKSGPSSISTPTRTTTGVSPPRIRPWPPSGNWPMTRGSTRPATDASPGRERRRRGLDSGAPVSGPGRTGRTRAAAAR